MNNRIKLSLSLIVLTLVASAQSQQQIQITPLVHDSVTNVRYARSFQDLNGEVEIQGHLKVIRKEDGQLAAISKFNPLFPEAAIKEGGMNTFFINQDYFIALGYKLLYLSDSTYHAKMWYSSDDLKTVIEGEAKFILSEAGVVNYGQNGEWAGLFCHRGIIQLPDNSFLAAVYGNFESDSIIPSNPQSKLETKFKLRSFVVRSTDMGKTWRYYASLAVPQRDQTDDSEGFNEWNMEILNDGRLLAVIRTGHFTQPVICFSNDQGRTWSEPAVNPELGPTASDPCLLKLSDGRIALAYGQMEQPEGNKDQFFKDFKAGDHLRRCRLAVSTTPEADHWQVWNITDFGNRSAYPTIFEMEPGLLLYQSGMELYQIKIIR